MWGHAVEGVGRGTGGCGGMQLRVWGGGRGVRGHAVEGVGRGTGGCGGVQLDVVFHRGEAVSAPVAVQDASYLSYSCRS